MAFDEYFCIIVFVRVVASCVKFACAEGSCRSCRSHQQPAIEGDAEPSPTRVTGALRSLRSLGLFAMLRPIRAPVVPHRSADQRTDNVRSPSTVADDRTGTPADTRADGTALHPWRHYKRAGRS
jgi:hypothetical protein